MSECAASGGRLASPTECDTFENLRLALINKFGPSGAGLKFSLGNMANGLANAATDLMRTNGDLLADITS